MATTPLGTTGLLGREKMEQTAVQNPGRIRKAYHAGVPVAEVVGYGPK